MTLTNFCNSIPRFLTLLSIAMLAASPAYSAAYLKLGDIKGESQAADEGHKDWIELTSVSWPTRAAPTPASLSSGRAQISEVTVSKSMDTSSARLSEACANGTHYPEAELHISSTAGRSERMRYHQYRLTNVMVTCTSGGSRDDGSAPTENITLHFSRIEMAPAATARPSAIRPARVTPRPVIQSVPGGN